MMDPKCFKNRLEELAEIKPIKPAKTHEPAELNQAVINGETVTLTNQFNPTLGFELLKVKTTSRLCELGCGCIVENQVIERRLCTQPEKHWRIRCNCGNYVNPKGDGFVKGGSQIAAAFISYFNENNK